MRTSDTVRPTGQQPSHRPRLVAQSLHTDVLLQIFDRLEARDITACARVCKHWRHVADDNDLWKRLHAQVTGVRINADTRLREMSRGVPLASQPLEKISFFRYPAAAIVGTWIGAWGLATWTLYHRHTLELGPQDPPPASLVPALLIGFLGFFVAIPCVNFLEGIPSTHRRNRARLQARAQEAAAQTRLSCQNLKRQTMQKIATKEKVLELLYGAIKDNDVEMVRRILSDAGQPIDVGCRPDPILYARQWWSWRIMAELYRAGYAIGRKTLLELIGAERHHWQLVSGHMRADRRTELLASLTPADMVALVRFRARCFDFLDEISPQRRRQLIESIDPDSQTSALIEAPTRISDRTFVEWLELCGGMRAQVNGGALAQL